MPEIQLTVVSLTDDAVTICGQVLSWILCQDFSHNYHERNHPELALFFNNLFCFLLFINLSVCQSIYLIIKTPTRLRDRCFLHLSQFKVLSGVIAAELERFSLSLRNICGRKTASWTEQIFFAFDFPLLFVFTIPLPSCASPHCFSAGFVVFCP